MTINAVALSRNQIQLLALLAGLVVLNASPAFAERVIISGKHSKDEIKQACAGLDSGFMVAGPGGKGYGCYNEKNGVLVTCDDGGECIGWIPEKRKMPTDSKILDFLTLGNAAGEGSKYKGDRQPFDPFAIVKK